MHRDTVTRFWGLLWCYSSTAITMSQGFVHNSWKLKISKFFHGLHTHQTYHLLSMFGMLWIAVYDSKFQFPPISCNCAQPLKRSRTTFHKPQSTAWSSICKGDGSCCMRQMVVTPDTNRFSIGVAVAAYLDTVPSLDLLSSSNFGRKWQYDLTVCFMAHYWLSMPKIILHVSLHALATHSSPHPPKKGCSVVTYTR